MSREDKSGNIPIEHPWAMSTEEVLEKLSVSAEQGLSKQEAGKRLEKYGENRIRAAKRRSTWQILIAQFKNLIVALLAAAAVAAFSFGQALEGVAIIIAIALNILIGFFTELKAVRSMESLEKMSAVEAKVIRDSDYRNIRGAQLVPGDIVPLEAGDITPADMRIIEASKLFVDESPLTGESVPVGKKEEAIEEDVPLAERRNMIFKGTGLTGGSGLGVVTATGMHTELGQISEMAEEAGEDEGSPLEKRLEGLGKNLVWAVLVIAAIVGGIGFFRGQDTFLIIETAIALAVAAIPEGLPIVATVALARGMWRMARRNALINKLSAVETLGATTVIFTDKTGTLTQNRMTADRYVLAGPEGAREVEATEEGFENDPEEDEILKLAIKVGVLCNNADLPDNEDGDGEPVGDPTEVALLQAGRKVGMRREDLIKEMPEEREVAFDTETKKMATFHKDESGLFLAVKGAPEEVLQASSKIAGQDGDKDLSEEDRQKWLEKNRELAERGLRILGLAWREAESADEEAYENLIFLGFVGLYDPPGEQVRRSVDKLHQAGLRIIMVTGDHPATARGIGREVGLRLERGQDVLTYDDLKDIDQKTEEEKEHLRTTSIFARVSPKQKLDLIDLYKNGGAIVAMTGDGVNDAPALKKADIGVAMGKRGTQVAREASDMILKDDAFSTIATAVAQGRAIFGNIRKFIIFLLSGNVGSIMIVAGALLVGWGLPLLPLQILYLNMIGDVFPALALGLGEGSPEIMKRPPRDPEEPIVAKRHWWLIVGYGALIAAVALFAYKMSGRFIGADEKEAISTAFLTLSFARLWHTFNMRDRDSGLLNNDVLKNKYVWGALGISTVLLLIAVYVPILAQVLKVVNPGMNGWGYILGLSLVPLVVVQIVKLALKGKVERDHTASGGYEEKVISDSETQKNREKSSGSRKSEKKSEEEGSRADKKQSQNKEDQEDKKE